MSEAFSVVLFLAVIVPLSESMCSSLVPSTLKLVPLVSVVTEPAVNVPELTENTPLFMSESATNTPLMTVMEPAGLSFSVSAALFVTVPAVNCESESLTGRVAPALFVKEPPTNAGLPPGVVVPTVTVEPDFTLIVPELSMPVVLSVEFGLFPFLAISIVPPALFVIVPPTEEPVPFTLNSPEFVIEPLTVTVPTVRTLSPIFSIFCPPSAVETDSEIRLSSVASLLTTSVTVSAALVRSKLPLDGLLLLPVNSIRLVILFEVKSIAPDAAVAVWNALKPTMWPSSVSV